MKQSSRKTLVLIIFLFPLQVLSFDDLTEQFNLDILYHYSRLERTTLIRSDNIQSREGLMLQFEYEEPIDLFWRWYVGGDITYANYEAAATTSFSPRQRYPWQLFVGTGFQLGALKSFEIFLGGGGSSEHLLIANGVNSFDFQQKLSARVHIGFSWRFLSIIGSSARMLFRYSTPVTPINHNGTDLNYKGIFDATLRLRGRYDSSWSLYGGARFEDYQVSDESVTYFTSRLYAGLGLHF